MQLILHTIEERIMDKEDDAVNEKMKHTGGGSQLHDVDTIDKSTAGTNSDTERGNDEVGSLSSSDGYNSVDEDKSTNSSESWRNTKNSKTRLDESRETDIERGIGNGNEADPDANNDVNSDWSNDAEINSTSSEANSSSKLSDVAKPTTTNDFETDMCMETNSESNEADFDAEPDQTRNDADMETNEGIDINNINRDSLKDIERHGEEVDFNERRDDVAESLGDSLEVDTSTDQNNDDVGINDDGRSIGEEVNNTEIDSDRNTAASLETHPPEECSQVEENTPAPKTDEIKNTIMAEILEKTTPISIGVDEPQPFSMMTNQPQHPGLNLESLLPHEGQRWAMLRDKMMTASQFEQYARRTQADPPWSADEAFISFFLDR